MGKRHQNRTIFCVAGPLWGESSQWRGVLMSSLMCAWTNGWANNRDGADLRRHRLHYDVTLMVCNESIYHARCLVVLCFVAVVILVPTAFTPRPPHYNDIIMTAMASQITSLAIVYSTVYSGADQRKHQSSVSLAFVRGIHRWPVNLLLIGPVTRKMFLFDDVIMRRHLYHSRITACVLNVLSPFFPSFLCTNSQFWPDSHSHF